MKNILIGIDFDDQTDLLLEKAVEFARKFNAKLHLLHVSAPLPEYVGFEVSPHYTPNGVKTVLEMHRKKLDALVKKVKDKGLDAEGIVMQGVTTNVIVDEAAELNVDLIICGHEEHNILYNMLFGSVSASVVRNAELPVLVFPLKEK